MVSMANGHNCVIGANQVSPHAFRVFPDCFLSFIFFQPTPAGVVKVEHFSAWPLMVYGAVCQQPINDSSWASSLLHSDSGMFA
jgi:hypothetical protein